MLLQLYADSHIPATFLIGNKRTPATALMRILAWACLANHALASPAFHLAFAMQW